MSNDTCSFEDCARPREKRGWCSTHYARWRKHGDPSITLRPWKHTVPAAERWQESVATASGSDCWFWVGSTSPSGYAQMTGDDRRPIYVHRLTWELANGPIPQGCEIDHLCRVRNCVNPDHLEAVDHRENNARGTSPTALNGQKSHCPSGHAYEGYNVMVSTRGWRQCRECQREHNRKWYAANYRKK